MSNQVPGVMGVNPPPPGVTTGGVGPALNSFTAPGLTGIATGAGTAPPAALVVTGWPRDLTWADFSEIQSRPSGTDENAQIHSEITQPDHVAVQRQNGRYRVVSLTVNLSVDQSDSWVVSAQKSPELLSHEQGHYDLTGLMGRQMGNEILAARAPTAHALQILVTGIITRYRQQATHLNEQYDTATDHGQNREAQRQWDERIHNSIQRGTRFSAP